MVGNYMSYMWKDKPDQETNLWQPITKISVICTRRISHLISMQSSWLNKLYHNCYYYKLLQTISTVWSTAAAKCDMMHSRLSELSNTAINWTFNFYFW